MRNDEATVARLLPEPPDGTRLVVQTGEHEYKVIWRDDAAARKWDPEMHEGDRWWADETDDPMGLYEHAKYAVAVWPFGAEPLARF